MLNLHRFIKTKFKNNVCNNGCNAMVMRIHSICIMIETLINLLCIHIIIMCSGNSQLVLKVRIVV